MDAERYKSNLLDVLHKMYPDGIPHNVEGLELFFKDKRYQLPFDRTDYEQHQTKKPRTFSQRLTKTDKRFLSDHRITT